MTNNLGGTIKPLYNGNIAETFWKTDSDNVIRNYGYQYDNLNRLTASIYQRNGFETHSYDETLNYDKNGNIKWLNRNGYVDNPAPGMTYSIDQLTYTYKPNSNRLDVVHDNSNSVNGFRDGNFNGTDYQYDDNGNMIIDRNKGIQTISYNHLNLPVEITFSNDGKISYLYNALGSKIKKSVTMPSQVETTDYLGGFQYKNEVLQYFPTAEGYVNVTDGTFFNYVYNYTDHLGNIRLSYTQSGTELKILEENHYYPFGLKHNNYNTDKVQFKKSEFGTSAVLQFAERNNNQYKYNGKEYQDELGLNWYDYQARNYDSALGRWMNIDPLAEMSRRFSPYTYALNNPVYFIDPDGMLATPPDWFVNNKTGAVVHVEGKSTLSQETADKIGAGDAKNYDRLGADNMFGDSESANEQRELAASNVENPESFMKNQGYVKAKEVEMKESTHVNGGSMGAGENITLTSTVTQPISESKVTYAKPTDLNKKTDVITTNDNGRYSSTVSTTYSTKVRFNKDPSSSPNNRTFQIITLPLQIASGLLTDFIESKK